MPYKLKSDEKEYNDTLYQRHKDMCFSVLGGVCKSCGSIKELEIDHIDPTTKTMRLGLVYGKIKLKEVLEELKKCQLLCHKCHKEKTSKENSERMLAIGFKHGTMYGWMKKKCSCTECTQAKRDFHTKRNKERNKGIYKPRV